jgi:hypothetical protein
VLAVRTICVHSLFNRAQQNRAKHPRAVFMASEVVEVYERFFLQKIKQDLEREGQPLRPSEQQFLLTLVNEITETGVGGMEAKALISRCVGALHRQYVKETGAGSSDISQAFTAWREQNTQLYRTSRRIISCVAQRWYITLGREQELKIRRTGMLYTWYSNDAQKLWDTLLQASRIMPRREPKKPDA